MLVTHRWLTAGVPGESLCAFCGCRRTITFHHRVQYQLEGAPGPYHPDTPSPWTAPPCHRDRPLEQVVAVALRASSQARASLSSLDHEVRELRGLVLDLGVELPMPREGVTAGVPVARATGGAA